MKNVRLSLLLALAITINIAGTQSQRPQLGGSVGVYHHYGHLEKTIRVMPMNDDSQWFFREHSVNVVRDPVAVPKVQQPQNLPRLFHGDIRMQFCDSIGQLPKSYFREFQFEGIQEPWRAFNADWSNDSIAKRFGFNATYTGSNYGYVLIKFERFHGTDKLATSPNNVEATETVAAEIERIEEQDVFSLIEFLKNFGSHYISAYTTGNALYQVFVYTRSYYNSLETLIRKHGLFQISFFQLSLFFSPYYAVQVGAIKSASGNNSLDPWIADKLKGRHSAWKYTSLMKLHRNQGLTEQLNTVLHEEAVLRMQLRTVASLVNDPAKREWFKERIAVPWR